MKKIEEERSGGNRGGRKGGKEIMEPRKKRGREGRKDVRKHCFVM